MTETETIDLGGGYAITLPSKPGHRWEKCARRPFLDPDDDPFVAIYVVGAAKKYFLQCVPIEPAWASIPEGTPCRIALDAEDAPIVRLAWRKGCSFSTDELGLDGTVQPERVLTATPLRVLADDEIAIKRPCADALEAEVAK